MPPPLFVGLDRAAVYYLAFDLLLATVPVRGGIARAREGRVVDLSPNGQPSDFWHAAIRAELLRVTSAGAPIWDHEIRSAEAHATKLAKEVGLDAPPEVPRERIVGARVSGEMRIDDLLPPE